MMSNNKISNIYVAIFFIFCFFSIFSKVFASETVGSIDPNFSSTKVCYNPACSSYQIVNFTPSNGTPVVITDSGISGDIWFQESSWASLNPVNGGVTNTPEGVLGGMAWGQAASWINFAPSNGGVSINSNGEFVGYAWVSGISGGWMKFDCGDVTTCIKTDWRPLSARSVAPPVSNNDNNNNVGGGGGGGNGPIGNNVPINLVSATNSTTTIIATNDQSDSVIENIISAIKYYFVDSDIKKNTAQVSNVDIKVRNNSKNNFAITGVDVATNNATIDENVLPKREEPDSNNWKLIITVLALAILGMFILNKNNPKGGRWGNHN